MLKYPALVRELDPSEGGGYLVEIPDLPGCMADGETREEALTEAEHAIEEWIETAKKLNRPVPEPGAIDKYSGRWVQRVPKSLHMKLSAEAKREGVSLNTLAATLLAEGLGKRERAS